ncbi:HAD-IIB family hydrolase [Deferribacter abyssi]|uniref:HAD-IIB family hydrolase n=1 Tax=Deferribacter abyssi TaxID=213806 RepID=UPI003C1389CC
MKKIIIFTDLDGTLLDHNTYSYEAAKEAIAIIKKINVPLIFTTSKTRAEVLKLQEDMGIYQPFIVENGGGIIFREKDIDENIKRIAERLGNGYYALILGEKREDLIKFGQNLKKKCKLKLFSEMEDDELIRIMGLPYEKLLLSKMRDFSEPFILMDECVVEVLLREVEKSKFKILKGGRFYHLVGKYQDKGNAVEKVKKFYMKKYKNIVTIGIGDSSNDIDLLEKVDYPVLVKRWDGEHVECRIKNVIKSELVGPKGFNYEVIRLLKILGVFHG